MSEAGDSSLEWTLAFEPDEDGEEELAPEEEPIDKALITDDTIRKCRIIASVRSIEYGEIEIAPSQTKPGALLAIDFQQLRFFNLRALMIPRAKKQFGINFTESSVSATLPPESATAGSERETERNKKFALRIRGSGNNTKRATWTLRENPQTRGGIHLNFRVVVILKVDGQIEV
ncbi:hypothetical protein NA56DRAFT_748013 [Hyaloscypha hepaticicola]|uniref:Uncharacterized protein n=1 Tax=Hyaloscypha hepaticicola TaxID=2082293 RepID=A0A2J6Q7K6_9HELO|nr:hypothetical protein NA56DRAFT_748013 [Hyaloscypha hepaticicola]